VILLLSPSLKELERRIKAELKDLELSVYFKIDSYDSKTGALLHTIGYRDVIPNEDALKINEVIRRHFVSWRK